MINLQQYFLGGVMLYYFSSNLYFPKNKTATANCNSSTFIIYLFCMEIHLLAKLQLFLLFVLFLVFQGELF